MKFTASNVIMLHVASFPSADLVAVNTSIIPDTPDFCQPPVTSAWQLAQSKIHLSASASSSAYDLVTPACAMPKDFVDGSM